MYQHEQSILYKIDAVIRPDRLDEVKEALASEGFGDFVVTTVLGHGASQPRSRCYRGISYLPPFTQRLRVELSVADSSLDKALECILAGAYTGNADDGTIMVMELADVIEIGSGSHSSMKTTMQHALV